VSKVSFIFVVFVCTLFSFLLIYPATARSAPKDDIHPLIDTPGKTIGSDFNGDGIHDFIVGAILNDDGGAGNDGAAYIFFGSTTLSGTKDLGAVQSADVTILGKGANERLGRAVSSAGDINGDGLDDIIVGAYRNADGASLAGAAYIIFGATTLSGTKDTGNADEDVRILGKADTDYLGEHLSAAGDINGDGFDDIIVGARNNDDAAANAGAAYIFFGASNLSGTKDLGGCPICRCDHFRQGNVKLFRQKCFGCWRCQWGWI